MPSIILSALPLPPSENEAYKTVSSGKVEYRTNKNGKEYATIPTWRAASKELKAFQEEMRIWRLRNLRLATAARNFLVSPLSEYQQLIRVDRFFAFKHERLFTLDGRPKSLDASNRVKAFDDALATEILGLDDCWFWKGVEEKVECGQDEQECAVAILTPILPRTLSEILESSPEGRPLILDEIQAKRAIPGTCS